MLSQLLVLGSQKLNLLLFAQQDSLHINYLSWSLLIL